jgi:hypothetical protein
MEVQLHLPQLEIDELLEGTKSVDAVGASTGIAAEACPTELEALAQVLEEFARKLEASAQKLEVFAQKFRVRAQKLKALILATAAPGPVSQPEPLQSEPAKRAAQRGHAQKESSIPKQTVPDAKGEDHGVEDEDTLRARVDFEAKRTTRQFGIGATRAAIKRIAGDAVLRVDEVPAVLLPTLLAELQAL